MRGKFWAVLAPDAVSYARWSAGPDLPEGFSLQRCKLITTMLDVYQAQKGGVEVIQLDGWISRWNGGQIEEIKRRLQL